MLHKCANSSCSNLFRRLHEGKLFQVETEFLPAFRAVASWRRNQPVRKVERFWLCGSVRPANDPQLRRKRRGRHGAIDARAPDRDSIADGKRSPIVVGTGARRRTLNAGH